MLLIRLIEILEILILVDVLFTWIAPGAQHPLLRALRTVTDPVLNLFRSWVPRVGRLDLSPVVALILLEMLKVLLLRLLQP